MSATSGVLNGEPASAAFVIASGSPLQGTLPLKPPAANLKVMAPQHSDGDLAWKIAEGRGAMPPWKGTLSENDIWDVVNYIKQFASEEKSHGRGHDDKHHDDKHHDDKHRHDDKHGHK